MGNLLVEISDSSQGPVPVSSKGADDLLSQLAGNEIDRLLAEADSALHENQDPAAAPPTAQQLDAVLTEAQAPHGSAPVESAQAATVADALPPGEERDALLQAAGFAPESQDSAASEEPERTALLQAAGFESEEDQDLGESDLADTAPAGESWLSFLLKPLEWLNAPFQSVSFPMRTLLGRAGIVTLINAAAVFTYVMFFRKH